MGRTSRSYLTQYMSSSPLSFSPSTHGGEHITKEQTPVQETCATCKYHGKMTIKRGRKKVIIYCPQCGELIYRRFIH